MREWSRTWRVSIVDYGVQSGFITDVTVLNTACSVVVVNEVCLVLCGEPMEAMCV